MILLLSLFSPFGLHFNPLMFLQVYKQALPHPLRVFCISLEECYPKHSSHCNVHDSSGLFPCSTFSFFQRIYQRFKCHIIYFANCLSSFSALEFVLHEGGTLNIFRCKRPRTMLSIEWVLSKCLLTEQQSVASFLL